MTISHHAPRTAGRWCAIARKWPAHARKLCLACAGKLIAAAERQGEQVNGVVTPMTVSELSLYYRAGGSRQ